jgi:hypothetical protein
MYEIQEQRASSIATVMEEEQKTESTKKKIGN